ncbi:hypothetical protein ACIHJG_37205 [Streptomyces sp. NPDC052415]|uniref:hypothetical protein n=1 Tax=Streptomyces sp. NPDC052415 TaxID=3365690 RepID=UPI0037D917D5
MRSSSPCNTEGHDKVKTNYSSVSVLNDLGYKLAAVTGTVSAEDGYCLPEKQHQRVYRWRLPVQALPAHCCGN